jgi:hypothetical protein
LRSSSLAIDLKHGKVNEQVGTGIALLIIRPEEALKKKETNVFN